MLLLVALVLLVGAAGGALNGVLVAYGRLQPILVTLATLSIYQGLAIKVLPAAGRRDPARVHEDAHEPERALGAPLRRADHRPLARLPAHAARRRHLRDRQRRGGRARARRAGAQREGRRLRRSPGILAAAGGLFLAATTTSGDATSGDVFVLTSIAAVVLGGISFFGGRGSAIGTIAGAFVLTLLINVLFFAGIDPLYQSFFQGLFLVVAVLLGTLIRRLVGMRA